MQYNEKGRPEHEDQTIQTVTSAMPEIDLELLRRGSESTNEMVGLQAHTDRFGNVLMSAGGGEAASWRIEILETGDV